MPATLSAPPVADDLAVVRGKYAACQSIYGDTPRLVYCRAYHFRRLTLNGGRRIPLDRYTRIRLRVRIANEWRERYGSFPPADVLDWILPLNVSAESIRDGLPSEQPPMSLDVLEYGA